MNDGLSTALRQLRLSGMVKTLDVRLQEAAGNHLSHQDFLELIVKDELAVRNSRQIERRVKAAGFRDQKTLEDFDWRFNTTIKRQQFYDLATGDFVRQATDVLLVGPPGVGKSHLAQALGYQLIKRKRSANHLLP
jgi:DNA replication protein DnaC